VISRGDIRWFRFGQPDKRRPVLIVAAADLLPALPQIPVIPLSTQIRGLAWEVPLGPADGVFEPCVLKPEWIRIVERSAIGPRITQLAESRWPEVRASLLRVLGLAE
jgi:mRNA interferase MazF